MRDGTDAARLLGHAGVTMRFEKTSARNAPYLKTGRSLCVLI
jgi:hypothetical protein